MVFVKPGCILDVQVNIENTPFDLNEYIRPSVKLLVAELDARNKGAAVSKAARATGFEESQLMACEAVKPAFINL
jgi:hypothetical protein